MNGQVEISRAVAFSSAYVAYRRMGKYLNVGGLLHIVSLLGFLLIYGFGSLANHAWKGEYYLTGLLFALIAGYGGILPFFAQLDALSRFQNYKKAKDLFYENGFKTRIAGLYIGSRCQRDAVKIAAKDLGFDADLSRFYVSRGYRWYHVLPDFIFFRPGILFTRKYWQRTLFEKRYQSKYFLW